MQRNAILSAEYWILSNWDLNFLVTPIISMNPYSRYARGRPLYPFKNVSEEAPHDTQERAFIVFIAFCAWELIWSICVFHDNVWSKYTPRY